VTGRRGSVHESLPVDRSIEWVAPTYTPTAAAAFHPLFVPLKGWVMVPLWSSLLSEKRSARPDPI
jgi:hypothetical protein